MILKELTTDHYIVIDDSEIKEGDWTYNTQSKTIFIATNSLINLINSPNVVLTTNKKITHSTDISWIEIDYIPLSEVKELIGELDMDKKVEEVYPQTYYSGIHIDGFLKAGYVKGYNQAIEDNKDRKYTEEDLRNAYRHGTTVNHGTKEHFNSFIQSFQPKTEWEVEFDEQGKLRLV